MARVRFRVSTPLAPAAVIEALTDFGPTRAERWPNIEPDHYQLHEQGPGWAEVTEGTSLAWERERYEWDAAKGEVSVRTLDSNTWGPGSGWQYRLTPSAGGGTAIDVTADRHGIGARGKLIELLVALAGRWLLKSQMEQALKSLRTP